MDKNKLSFIFHFYRREESQNNRVLWKIIIPEEDVEIIVDSIIVNVSCSTLNRDIRPSAVMIGKGKIRFENYKEDQFDKIRAIIE